LTLTGNEKGGRKGKRHLPSNWEKRQCRSRGLQTRKRLPGINQDNYLKGGGGHFVKRKQRPIERKKAKMSIEQTRGKGEKKRGKKTKTRSQTAPEITKDTKDLHLQRKK